MSKHKKADPPRETFVDARHDSEAATSSPQWNNISRKWFRMVGGEVVAMDPQPPPPQGAAIRGSLDGGRHYGAVPPAVKVMA